MAEIKTKPTRKSVRAFLEGISDVRRRSDALVLLDVMKEITRSEPRMWGDSVVGFGSYHYRYASGHEGNIYRIGFSPRKQALVLYIFPGYEDYKDILKKLGPHTIGKSCLYIKRLSDIHIQILKKLLKYGYMQNKKLYPAE